MKRCPIPLFVVHIYRFGFFRALYRIQDICRLARKKDAFHISAEMYQLVLERMFLEHMLNICAVKYKQQKMLRK